MFKEPVDISHEAAEEFGKELADIIVARLSESRAKDGTLRVSNLGRCTRQLWYEAHGELDPEELRPETRIKFLYGDLIETMLLFLAKVAGHTVERQQEEVDINGIKGHIDGVVDGVLVDVKSASGRAFQKFKENTLEENDSFGYMEQIAGYSRGLGGLDVAFLAMNKETGALALTPFSADYLASIIDVGQLAEDCKNAMVSDNPPERPYEPEPHGKSGNMTIPKAPCHYCSRKQECWNDANDGFGLRTFLYSTGPTHFTHIENEPKTPELTWKG